MNEKVIPKMPLVTEGVHGKYTIQLFDAETNELVQEVENHNMVNPFISTILFTGIYASPMLIGNYGSLNISALLSDSIGKGMADVLNLFKSSVEPKDSLTMYPFDLVSIGWSDLRSPGGSNNNYRGNVNVNESYTKIAVSEEGNPVIKKHLVIDFLTNQANGTFNNLSIGPDRSNTYAFENFPTSSSQYRDYSFEKYPQLKINSSTWAPEGVTKSELKSVSGPLSIESDHIFWICGASNSKVRQTNLCFYKFDISEGTLNCTQVVQLSGAPDELNQSSVVGVRCKGKFFVFSDNSSLRNNMYRFSETGSYESKITISQDISREDFWTYGSFVGLPNCIMESRSSGYNDSVSFRVIDTDGSVLFIKQDSSLTKFYNDLSNGSEPVNSIKFVPVVLSNNKIIVTLFKNANKDFGLVIYDPTTNKFEKSPFSLYWTKYRGLSVSDVSNSSSVFKNQCVTLSESGFNVLMAMPWWSWSKLPTEITKTSSTTMKIQYDVEIPIIMPGSMQLFNKK